MTGRSLCRAAAATLWFAATLVVGAAAPAHADTVWLCLPGMADNPCEGDLTTTVREPSGEERVVAAPLPARRDIDCFYVYPTVSNQTTPNADRSRDPELESIALYQAARFSQHCRVFAPIYRQGTLLALGSSSVQDSEQIRATAFSDVRDAWRDYLVNHNGGRGVVLIGHSQGTRMLRQLIRTEIDGRPREQRRLVSALLIGGNVTVRRGSPTGGDFQHVPLCTRRGQLGCVVAYSTFSRDPPDNPRYGRPDGDGQAPFDLPTGPDYRVACTDPFALAGVPGHLRLLVPTEPYAPGPIAAGIVVTAGGMQPTAPTPWVVPADRWTGGCAEVNGARVLRYEPAAGSRRPLFFPDPGWGTHLVDVNITHDQLLAIVERQAERYLRPRLRLTRTCVGGGRLRLQLRGGDVDLVRRAVFRFGNRRVARARRQPFRRVVGRRKLARGLAGRLRAVAHMDAGARDRLVLRRSLPNCGV